MTRTLLLSLVVLAGCGPIEADVALGEAQSTDGEELSASARSYVTVRHDTRKCAAPRCGGYFVADVNRATLKEQYVSALDVSGAGGRLDAAALEAGDGELVLHGKLGPLDPATQTRAFLVSDAWRGMPGVKVAAGDTFFSTTPLNVQCLAAPCPTLSTKKLNSTATKQAHRLEVGRAALPLVDTRWLAARVSAGEALVAGRFVDGARFATGTERVLDASQVFLHLPVRQPPCPMLPLHQCPPGQVHSGARTADRCVLYTACVTPRMCTQQVPTCADGYWLVSWAGGTGACTTYACDPTFSLP